MRQKIRNLIRNGRTLLSIKPGINMANIETTLLGKKIMKTEFKYLPFTKNNLRPPKKSIQRKASSSIFDWYFLRFKYWTIVRLVQNISPKELFYLQCLPSHICSSCNPLKLPYSHKVIHLVLSSFNSLPLTQAYFLFLFTFAM